MIFEMLRWWYISGWLQAARRVVTLTRSTSRTFSIPMLLGTLFSPWRRVVAIPGRSLDARIKAAFDNFISRCVGLVVRVLVLFVAVPASIGTASVAVGLAIVWPLLPVACVYFIFRGITG